MSETQETSLDLTLTDADSECLGSLPVRIVVSDTAISIYPQGYGDCGSADGYGCPLFIEFYGGSLRVVAFPDINCEDPKVIDLSRAKEDRRQDTNDLHHWTPLQQGRRFHEFMTRINPATGKPFTMNEAASALGVDHATFRTLAALWRSQDTRLNDEGNAQP